MKRTYLYPSFLLSIPIGIVCFICFFGALVILNNPTASLIMALADLLILCVGSYTCPIVSFDEERIYIHRLFPGTTKRIRWDEIRSISPLEHGGLAGLACLICTDKKEYALTIFLRGWHKLLGHWDSIRPAAATAPLKRNLLLEGTYQKPFWKTSGFFIALFMLFLWLCTYPATNGGQYLIGFILLLVILLLLFLLFGGCYFNHYEFTPTHFCIRSPFPFWNYKVRWEDIHSIRQYSAKADFICICTRQYRYKYIMMGYLLPKETITQLQAAGVSIE